MVAGHLERIAAKKFVEIGRLLKIAPEEIRQAANLIGTLNPRPGQAYSSESSPYITPEVIVHKVEGEYVVILNDDQLPHLRISKQYRSLMSDASTTDEVKKYIVEKIRSGVFLMKSIGQRQQTIFKIASEIVRVQRAFFDHGIAHLKPLVMSEVALAVGLHETTVSRAASGKHMQTPRGVFEIKFFFTPGLKTTDGAVLSNLSVKDLISSLIKAENPAHPLADQDIYEALTAKGINIARRTVAKYRIALRIPPSHLRKTG
jgi:RNA polymerase sigma-54 factor